MSDPTAFKTPQVPSSVLAALGLYSQSFKILNAVESSVALSNYYLELGARGAKGVFIMEVGVS